jgi:hypothetical protein
MSPARYTDIRQPGNNDTSLLPTARAYACLAAVLVRLVHRLMIPVRKAISAALP